MISFALWCVLCYKVRARLQRYLFWNGLLSVYIGAYFELFLLASLNILQVDWNNNFASVLYSNILAVTFFVFSTSLPAFILILLCVKAPEW